jgi:hypothetical protein
MNHLGLVASLQVPEDRSIIKESEIDHVLTLLKLGRVNLPNFRGLMGELLMRHCHNTLCSWVIQITRFQKALTVTYT